ncbi:MAG: hypothetical protein ACJ74Z_23530 [Bryobacteraceae bacterium]
MNSMPRPKFQATDEQRRTVKLLAGSCTTERRIALIMDLSLATLRKHFREELVRSPLHAKTRVLKRAYDQATSGRHPLMTMFYLKTRAGWSENGNRPESIPRREDRTWVIREYQPPTPPGYQNAFEEALRRREAANGKAWPEWEGDKGDPQEDQS